LESPVGKLPLCFFAFAFQLVFYIGWQFYQSSPIQAMYAGALLCYGLGCENVNFDLKKQLLRL
jgi:hypothetical protein